jgi:hypothetical protein
MAQQSNNKDTVILHRGQVEALLSLTSLKDVRTVLSAIVAYGMDGMDPHIPEHLLFGWVGIKCAIDYDRDQYDASITRRKAAAAKRWSAKQDDAKQCKASNAVQGDAKQCKASNAVQGDANDAYNRIRNRIRISKENNISFCDAIDDLLKIYPRVEYPELARRELALAITRKAESCQMTKELALAAIAGKTELYAKAKANLPEEQKQFIPDAARWFRDGGYDADPATWAVIQTVDPRDPATWDNQEE